jgi:hypothetical protein
MQKSIENNHEIKQGKSTGGIHVPRENLTKAELKQRQIVEEEIQREGSRINQKRQKKRITKDELRKLGLGQKAAKKLKKPWMHFALGLKTIPNRKKKRRLSKAYRSL